MMDEFSYEHQEARRQEAAWRARIEETLKDHAERLESLSRQMGECVTIEEIEQPLRWRPPKQRNVREEGETPEDRAMTAEEKTEVMKIVQKATQKVWKDYEFKLIMGYWPPDEEGEMPEDRQARMADDE